LKRNSAIVERNSAIAGLRCGW